MKAIYQSDDETLGLERGNVYEVFCVEVWKENNVKIYVKGLSRFIYPCDLNEFKVIDNTMPSFWKINIDNTGLIVLGPEEIFQDDAFWENYYNDIQGYAEMVHKYLEILGVKL